MATTKNGVLWIAGTEMPDPDVKGGITETDEKIWSSDTGRTTSGTMKGTLIATKTTVALKWSSLTQADAQLVMNAIRGTDFTTIKYKSERTNSVISLTGYFGTVSVNHLNLEGKLYFGTDISTTFIEQ